MFSMSANRSIILRCSIETQLTFRKRLSSQPVGLFRQFPQWFAALIGNLGYQELTDWKRNSSGEVETSDPAPQWRCEPQTRRCCGPGARGPQDTAHIRRVKAAFPRPRHCRPRGSSRLKTAGGPAFQSVPARGMPFVLRHDKVAPQPKRRAAANVQKLSGDK